VKETEFLRLKRSKLDVQDFEPLKVIGRGAFGEVSRPLYLYMLNCVIWVTLKCTFYIRYNKCANLQLIFWWIFIVIVENKVAPFFRTQYIYMPIFDIACRICLPNIENNSSQMSRIQWKPTAFIPDTVYVDRLWGTFMMQLLQLAMNVGEKYSLFLMWTGEVSTEERYRTCVCHEDITQSRHARKRTGELFAVYIQF